MTKEIELKLKEGDTAPDFTATTHEGKTISLSDFRGQSVILCTGVKDNYPEFDHWQEYVGRSMFWCITCDGFGCKGERVLGSLDPDHGGVGPRPDHRVRSDHVVVLPVDPFAAAEIGRREKRFQRLWGIRCVLDPGEVEARKGILGLRPRLGTLQDRGALGEGLHRNLGHRKPRALQQQNDFRLRIIFRIPMGKGANDPSICGAKPAGARMSVEPRMISTNPPVSTTSHQKPAASEKCPGDASP